MAIAEALHGNACKNAASRFDEAMMETMNLNASDHSPAPWLPTPTLSSRPAAEETVQATIAGSRLFFCGLRVTSGVSSSTI